MQLSKKCQCCTYKINSQWLVVLSLKDKNICSQILSMRVMESCFALINYHEIEISGLLSNFSVCRDLSSELFIRKLYVHLMIGWWCSKIVVAFSSSWSRWTGLCFYSFLWNFHLNLLSLKSDEENFPYKIKERRNFSKKSTKRSIKLFIYIFITANWLYMYLYILLLVIRIHFERTQSKETH